MRTYLKNPKGKRTGGVAQVVERLLSNYDALSSISTTTKRKKKNYIPCSCGYVSNTKMILIKRISTDRFWVIQICSLYPNIALQNLCLPWCLLASA
jgi:hypothetical protein